MEVHPSFSAAKTRDPDKGSQQKRGGTLSCSSLQVPQFHFSNHDSLPFPHLFLCYLQHVKNSRHLLPHSNLRKVIPFCSFLLEFLLLLFSTDQESRLITGYSQVISFRSVPFLAQLKGREGRCVFSCCKRFLGRVEFGCLLLQAVLYRAGFWYPVILACCRRQGEELGLAPAQIRALLC